MRPSVYPQAHHAVKSGILKLATTWEQFFGPITPFLGRMSTALGPLSTPEALMEQAFQSGGKRFFRTSFKRSSDTLPAHI